MDGIADIVQEEISFDLGAEGEDNGAVVIILRDEEFEVGHRVKDGVREGIYELLG